MYARVVSQREENKDRLCFRTVLTTVVADEIDLQVLEFYWHTKINIIFLHNLFKRSVV